MYAPLRFFRALYIQSREEEDSIEKNERRIAELIAAIEAKEYDKEEQWADLPSPPLETIYSFLNRKDQINMSQVCRKWFEEFSSPSVWETFMFDLLDTCPEIKFARKYSSMFRHVVIVYTEFHHTTSWRNLKDFLHILTSTSQLLSVKLLNLRKYFPLLDTPIRDDIFRAITSLLESQRHLRRVEFHGCSFRYQEVVELLKGITENSRESLTHLVLRERVVRQDSVVDQCLLTLVNQRFPRLKTLEIDYSLIFEHIFAAIGALKSCQMRALSKMILHCHGCAKGNFRGLTSKNWRILKHLCPDLQVELHFMSSNQSLQELEFFIVPDMPIILLRCEFIWESIMEIDALLNHLLKCNINHHLVSLYLEWARPILDLASTFIPFLLACTKLECFHLFTMYPANGVDLLVKSWLENKPKSLEKVFIYFAKVEDEDDYANFNALAAECESLLQAAGLKAVIKIC
ncbi:hypothetical protein AVEN_127044-1 [Araneus ventricosus]|uniref:F-box domain-containing protein n=1 Tax=Araneus ventricosus TaxID=182803 RepID=A0A4Y2VYY9_ARAVE|nr:hypothetical protein AVEN_127044-1 [Araneus ventricosus]